MYLMQCPVGVVRTARAGARPIFEPAPHENDRGSKNNRDDDISDHVRQRVSGRHRVGKSGILTRGWHDLATK